MTRPAQERSTLTEHLTQFFPRTNYLQLTQIYAVQVLGKLQKNYVAAHLWIPISSISDEEKQVMLRRFQLVSYSQKPSVRNTIQQTNETSSRGSGQSVQEIGKKMMVLDLSSAKRAPVWSYQKQPEPS